jgi:hypothetical protein
MVWTLFLSLIVLLSSSITLACGKGKSSHHSHSHSKSNAQYQARKAVKKTSRRHAKALPRAHELPPKYVKAEKMQELQRLPSGEDVVIEF